MRNKIFALLAATTATTIYGVNHTIAKLVMPHYIGSLGFVLLTCFRSYFNVLVSQFIF